MNKLACTLVIGFLITGCAPNSDLAETKVKLAAANAKIADLEAQLVRVTPNPPKADNSVSQNSNTPSVQSSLIGRQWEYDVAEDAMSGSKRYTATVKSSNTVSFGFPYTGAQHGTLTLRSQQGKGKDVLFYIERGQILCPSYEGCGVLVRFDDEKPMRFSATGPADHSSEIIFLSNYSNFVTKLKKAKRVRMAVEIYQNGAPAFEFDVNGFNPDKYQPKS